MPLLKPSQTIERMSCLAALKHCHDYILRHGGERVGIYEDISTFSALSYGAGTRFKMRKWSITFTADCNGYRSKRVSLLLKNRDHPYAYRIQALNRMRESSYFMPFVSYFNSLNKVSREHALVEGHVDLHTEYGRLFVYRYIESKSKKQIYVYLFHINSARYDWLAVSEKLHKTVVLCQVRKPYK
jgi:hypothetical protein